MDGSDWVSSVRYWQNTSLHDVRSPPLLWQATGPETESAHVVEHCVGYPA